MVRLTRIYTRTGDGGQTRLSDMSQTAKTDPRVAAYGDVDEANSAVGVALATGGLPADVADILRRIQNELFDLGADLSNPLRPPGETLELRIEEAAVERLEAWCDHFGDPLPSLFQDAKNWLVSEAAQEQRHNGEADHLREKQPRVPAKCLGRFPG